MAKIYSPPKSIPVPQPDYRNYDFKKAEREEFEWKQELRRYCVTKGSGERGVGTVISFPVADGVAQYMVFSVHPVVLIHLPLGDAWNYQYAHRLTIEDVMEQIRRAEFMDELFSRKASIDDLILAKSTD